MNYIFIIISSIIVSQILSNQIKSKLCFNCKFYQKPFSKLIDNEFGKCSLFIIDNDNNTYFLMNRNKVNNIEYTYCATARKYNDMCGEKGKLYEKKIMY